MQLAISSYSCCREGEIQLIALVWADCKCFQGAVLQVNLGYTSPAGMQKLGGFYPIKGANYSSEYPCGIDSIFVFT